MATFDLFMLIVLLVFYGLGWRRGFLWQAAGIASIVLGDLAARQFGPTVSEYIGEKYGLYHFMSWVIIYIAVASAVYLVAWRFRKSLEKEELEELDQHLGGVLGVVKGILIVSLISLLAMTLSERVRNHALTTVSGKVVANIAHYARNYLPKETMEALAPFYTDKNAPPPLKPTPTTAIPSTQTNSSKGLFQLPPWLNRSEACEKKDPRQLIKKIPEIIKKANSQNQGSEQGGKQPTTSNKAPATADHEFPMEPYIPAEHGSRRSSPKEPYDPYRYEPIKPPSQPR